MKIKTFNISQEKEANEFIDSVVIQDGGVQVVDNSIVIFYHENKETYEETFVHQMIDGLKRNLFHEKVRQVSNDAEREHWKEKGTNLKEFDEAEKTSSEINRNITLFKNKIEALEAWIANKS